MKRSKFGACSMHHVRLIRVDDDPGIREVLRALLDNAGAEVLAEADNGRSGIEEAERHHPELILLDVSMPVMGGFPAARYLRQHNPELKIILISQYNQKAYADEALQIGARGYIVKGSLATEIAPAIDAVVAGGTFVSARVAA
jgi:DNA-binding NarL/FixJ family response regulator